MGYSVKVKIDHYDPRSDGTAAIYLQVTIDRKKKRLPLHITWPIDKFSDTHYCKARTRTDPDVDQYNTIISDALAKANNIRKEYLLRSIHLTMDVFLKEYRTNLNKNDFIQYFSTKSFERWNTGMISQETYDNEKVTLRKIKKFYEVLPFNEFDDEWAFKFDRRLKSDVGGSPQKPSRFKEISTNGRWPRHKHVIIYLNMAARKDSIKFHNPYTKFKNILEDGSWKPLTIDQFKELLTFYIEWKNKPLPILYKQQDHRKGLTNPEVIILRRFLFACNCSLRISDLQRLDRSMFANNAMTIVPHKTKRHGTKI